MFIHVCERGNSKGTDERSLNRKWEIFAKIYREILVLAKFDKLRAILIRISNKHFFVNIQHA